MRLRETVFASGPERTLFKALESAWPDRITIYPNLPFLRLIHVQQAEVRQEEWKYIKAASVDYTACEKASDRPLVSVEFDGLGRGYSRDGQYFPLEGINADPYRPEKTALKLRLTNHVGYPFFVVSYDEAAPVTPYDELTVTHAIVGHCLAKLGFDELLQERLAQKQDLLDSLPPWDRYEVIQDMVIATEVELEFEWNPLTGVAAEALHSAWEQGVGRVHYEYLSDPPLPELKSWSDTEGLKRRAEGIRRAHRLGRRVTLEVKDSRETVTGEAWIRNITGHGFSPVSILQELAELVAARKFLAQVEDSQSAQGAS